MTGTPTIDALAESSRSRTAAVAVFLALLAAGCARTGPDPDVEPLRLFYKGLAALEAGADGAADSALTRFTELEPQEPAGFANRGLLAARRGEIERALQFMARALEAAPDDAEMLESLGRVLVHAGQHEEAVGPVRKSWRLDTSRVSAGYLLAKLQAPSSHPAVRDTVRLLFRKLRSMDPENEPLLLSAALFESESGQPETARVLLAAIRRRTDRPLQATDLLAQAQSQTGRGLTDHIRRIQNVMLRSERFRRQLSDLDPSGPDVARPVSVPRTIQLVASVAAPDTSLSYTAHPELLERPDVVAAIPLPFGEDNRAVLAAVLGRYTDEEEPASAGDSAGAANPIGLFLEWDGGRWPLPSVRPGRTASWYAIADFHNDYLPDAAFVGEDGLRVFRQVTDGVWQDATGGLGLPSDATSRPIRAVWAADADMEGDIDLVIAPARGGLALLVNRGDGSFVGSPWLDIEEVVEQFLWVDLDADGDPDAAIRGASGRVSVWWNDRGGRFVRQQVSGAYPAVAVADMDRDGRFDLMGLDPEGAVRWLQVGPETGRAGPMVPLDPSGVVGADRLIAADLDNSGTVDLVVSSPLVTRLWLQGIDGYVSAGGTALPAVTDVADLDDDGRLDLVSSSPQGGIHTYVAHTERAYRWQVVRPRASGAPGDGKINALAYGGEVEIRSGQRYQKQSVSSPSVRFGLGDASITDVLRITWPNGDVQVAFDVPSATTVSARQRLKGSCPWVFTHDGDSLRFVTDFLWRSPLGLRINAVETAGVAATRDRVRIPGSMLAEQDGLYDIRITAELWETHFFDYVALEAVDHPVGTHLFVDERFAFPSPADQLYVTSSQHAVSVMDGDGRDLTESARAVDGQYTDAVVRTAYQGVSEVHELIVELPDDPGLDRLVLFGWIRPTDSSINVALAQAGVRPRGIRVEVSEGEEWRRWRNDIGFPAGKNKTILIDLAGAFPATDADRRVRLTTNMEIYWDRISATRLLEDATVQVRRSTLDGAVLTARGFSRVDEATPVSPEIPEYSDVVSSRPMWRDLEGYYTAYGEVEELLAAVDDRYVIVNAGDELKMSFEALPPPSPGTVRDFVLIGDGWVKDGDLNTASSATVRPLPSHADRAYRTPLVSLESDPVYRRFPEDWTRYHTRYIAPDAFRQALSR